MSCNTVACVWRTGGDYDLEYVVRLYAGVLTLMPNAEIVCLTDSPGLVPALPHLSTTLLMDGWPGWWSKLELFNVFRTGRTIYFDLDTVIKGSLEPMTRFDGFTMLSNLGDPAHPASGVMAWDGDHAAIYRKFKSLAMDFMDEYAAGGDQVFLEDNLGFDPCRWQDLCPGLIASYKWGTRQEQLDASVICYHGYPRPVATGWAGLRQEPRAVL